MSTTQAAETPAPVLRAYRFRLDPTASQETLLRQHAGAARWAYNFALAHKKAAHEAYSARIKALTDEGLSPQDAKARFKQEAAALRDEAAVWEHHRQSLFNARLARAAPKKTPKGPRELIDRLAAVRNAVILPAQRYTDELTARLVLAPDYVAALTDELNTLDTQLAGELTKARKRAAAVKAQLFAMGAQIPGAMENLATWRQIRHLPREEGGSPWYEEVNAYAISTGMNNADAAWKNWLESFQGTRKGKRVGYPRFKAKGRARDSFTLYHTVKSPTIRPDGYRRINVPRIGSIRITDSNKRLTRLINKGDAVVKSVTIARHGVYWYASVLAELTPEALRLRECDARTAQRAPKKQQRENVGVEWGVRTLVTLSNGETFENGRPLKQRARRLIIASRVLSRKPVKKGQPTSANRKKAIDKLGRVHHEIARERSRQIHEVTARIAPAYRTVAVRELAVQQMTKSAKGTREKPGSAVKVQAAFNRAVLDTAPFELQRQLAYKTAQYGAELRVAPRDLPSSQTCSVCGWRDPSIPLGQVVFQCGNIACRAKLDREVNSSRVIRDKALSLASDDGESQNACGEAVRPDG